MFLWLKEILAWRTAQVKLKQQFAWDTREKELKVDAEIREYHAAERERQRQHALDLKICNSCQILEDELARSHSREKDLINLLKAIKEPESSVPFESKVELPNLRKPWAVKRQELEMKSRGDRRKVTADNLDEELELVKENAK